MPQTAQEYAAALETLRLRPANTSEGILAERTRIAAFLGFLGRPLRQGEIALLARRPAAGGSRSDRRDAEQDLRADLSKLRTRLVMESRQAYAFNTDSFTAGGGNPPSGSGVGGDSSPAPGPIGSAVAPSSPAAGPGNTGNGQTSAVAASGAPGGGRPSVLIWIAGAIVVWLLWRLK